MNITDFDVILRGMFVVLMVIFAISLAFGIALYVLRAIGMYSISKRRKLGTSGFAWVPILHLFKFGQIADDAILNKSGTRTHFMVFYPVFCLAGGIVSSVGGFIGSLSFYLPQADIEAIMRDPSLIAEYAPRVLTRGGLIVGCILLVLGFLLTLASEVMMYICCFHIYRSLTLSYIVMFILSFLFPFLIDIFLFAIRKTDHPLWYIPGRNPYHEYTPENDSYNNPYAE